MDPQACFGRWLTAVTDGDGSERVAAARNYNAWRARGGFVARDANGERVLMIGERGRTYWVLTDAGRRQFRNVATPVKAKAAQCCEPCKGEP